VAKSGSKSQEGYYSSYKAHSKWQSNRKRKLEKLLKTQPNNEQIKHALKNLKYRRKVPGANSIWSKQNIQVAKLFKLFTGFASHDLFSSNPQVQAAALMARKDTPKHKVPEGKVNFSLGARAHDSKGNLIWS
jgi:IS30 family transposase